MLGERESMAERWRRYPFPWSEDDPLWLLLVVDGEEIWRLVVMEVWESVRWILTLYVGAKNIRQQFGKNEPKPASVKIFATSSHPSRVQQLLNTQFNSLADVDLSR